MKLLDRYIARTILVVCVGVLFTITALDLLFAFIAELEDIRGDYTLSAAIEYTLMTAPRRFYEYVPMSVLVGCLVGLGLLANNSELTVMRAAGISKLRILGAVMQPVLLLILICTLLGEYVAPRTEQAAVAERAIARGGQDTLVQGGAWLRDAKRFLHVNAVRPDGSLHGITFYQLGEQRTLAQAGFARRADYRPDGQWLLQDIRVTHFEEGRTRVEQLAQQAWTSALTPDLLKVLAADPERMSMRGLYRYTQYLGGQDVNATAYRLAFWNKLLLPVAVIGLVLVAMSFVFGPLRSVPMGQRIMVGIVVGLTFKIVQDLLGPASTVYGFSPLIAALSPIALCYLIGGWLLKQAR
ncbi:LPS export ABC transporter permease LptG [Motiliproteus sp. SC1-56]|uniref:LPS export ABC transporter permease LptG n=1 Tax=Motiliproteus sp. SC1-56 TaxID=2799565 RepID=UPI001A8FF539|nr:LPS export ABC transporter permease LptG [Motiliproteus sp. SC1-56]